jgi:putative tryptophan/tyrosine transport system substrate-binding protein
MRRRAFVVGLGSAAAWPLVARAQQTSMPVVGFLCSESVHLFGYQLAAFHRGLSEGGYVEGRNVAIEYRWADGQNDRLAALAADLVRRQVAAIASNGSAVAAAKAATATIPIVSVMNNPVGQGLVASLNRPSGNLTGVDPLTAEVLPKRVELLRELLPTAKSFALLINPTGPDADFSAREGQAAARALGVHLHILHASRESDFAAVFQTLVQLQADGLVIGNDAFFAERNEQLATLAVRHEVPTIFQNPEFPVAGGLMSYGGDFREAWHLVGVYTGRILKGEKPADLPVQQYTKVELIINLKTAKALGLVVPQSILLRADKVIE